MTGRPETGRPQVRVAPVGPQDWALWRELRLEALRDTPIGFGERYAEAVRRTEEQWRAVVARPGLYLLAHDGQGPVAMAGGFLDPQDRPTLFAVYVRPRARGRRVLDPLVEQVERWAAPSRLRLEVHEDNGRAASAYARLGFVATGVRRPYPLDPTRSLLEMNRP